MAKYNYSFQKYNEKTMARAVGVSLPISFKQAREICHHMKHRSVGTAKMMLNDVLKMRSAIPFKRFDQDVGHKPGISAGRYPQNSTKEILKIVESAESNANNKGLTGDLYIVHMNSHRAASGGRGGRTDGEAKRAHVEVVVEERKLEKKEAKSRKETKK